MDSATTTLSFFALNYSYTILNYSYTILVYYGTLTTIDIKKQNHEFLKQIKAYCEGKYNSINILYIYIHTYIFLFCSKSRQLYRLNPT